MQQAEEVLAKTLPDHLCCLGRRDNWRRRRRRPGRAIRQTRPRVRQSEPQQVHSDELRDIEPACRQPRQRQVGSHQYASSSSRVVQDKCATTPEWRDRRGERLRRGRERGRRGAERGARDQTVRAGACETQGPTAAKRARRSNEKQQQQRR